MVSFLKIRIKTSYLWSPSLARSRNLTTHCWRWPGNDASACFWPSAMKLALSLPFWSAVWPSFLYNATVSFKICGKIPKETSGIKWSCSYGSVIFSPLLPQWRMPFVWPSAAYFRLFPGPKPGHTLLARRGPRQPLSLLLVTCCVLFFNQSLVVPLSSIFIKRDETNF